MGIFTLTYLYNVLGSYMAPAILSALVTVLGLVLGDWILGALVAMKQGKFSFSELPRFMETSFVPFVGGLLLLALFANTNVAFTTIFAGAAAAIVLKFGVDIKNKFVQLFSAFGVDTQSPVESKPVDILPIQNDTVSPQTDAATNTPAADKTLPADNADNAEPPKPPLQVMTDAIKQMKQESDQNFAKQKAEADQKLSQQMKDAIGQVFGQ